MFVGYKRCTCAVTCLVLMFNFRGIGEGSFDGCNKDEGCFAAMRYMGYFRYFVEEAEDKEHFSLTRHSVLKSNFINKLIITNLDLNERHRRRSYTNLKSTANYTTLHLDIEGGRKRK